MPKTLVCLIGQMRATELTWDTFKPCVLGALDADLAIAGAEEPETIMHRHAKYYWPWKEREDHGESFDYVAGDLGGPNQWRDILGVQGFWLGGIKNDIPREGRAACLYFWRWWLLKNLRPYLDDYDTFVITRSDLRWLANHPAGLDPAGIWLPDGEAYGGIPDRHTIVSRTMIEPVLRVVECLWLESAAVRDEMLAEKGRGHIWNVEQAFDFLFRRAGLSQFIRYFPYTMFSVRAPDGPTTWAIGEWREEQHCMVKYPTEYDLARKNIELMKGK